jgi:transketolase
MTTPAATSSTEQLSINTIRTLAMDAVEKANSGHPGTPMALAPVAYSLWNHILRYDPADAAWPNRDRFVLSCGHASMLLYATLHLAQVKRLGPDGKPTEELAVPLEEIKRFRQLHSLTPGHPERIETTGVETTTGPLGQGVANSVGMAIASRWMGARYNKPGMDLFDFNVYAMCSDGDMMEGISHEAASLAGHLKLSNLCWIYDDNSITIEGHTALAFSENVGMRFKGYGWNVIHIADANDTAALVKAYKRFLSNNKGQKGPTMIIVKSHIAFGSPHKQDTHGAHGAPLGADEIKATKAVYGWPEDAQFLVPDEAIEDFSKNLGARGRKLHKAWDKKFKQYRQQNPELAHELDCIRSGGLPEAWEAALPTYPADAKGTGSRISSGKVLNAVAAKIPWLIGGAADLAPSTMTNLTFDGAGSFEAETYGGRNFHFGIRELGMAAAANGMATCGLRAYCSTFFIFSDYLRPALRLSSIMKLPVLYVLTHDSIGVGEDGPTHEPVEHLAALRAIPGLLTIRPADANEVSEAYRVVLNQKDRPVAMILSRQNLPTIDRSKFAPAAGLAKGAYVVADAEGGHAQVILLATGSEVSLALEAAEKLKAEGVKARVVSMPCWELFDEQDEAYRNSVLPPQITARVGVEAGIQQGWEKYIGAAGQFVGMKSFGASAPGAALFKHFGFTVENVVAHAKAALGKA